MIEGSWTWHIGEDLSLVFTTPSPPEGGIGGWTITLTLYDKRGGHRVPGFGTTADITDATAGTFQFALDSDDTTASGGRVCTGLTMRWLQVRRTDAGHNTVLAEGPVSVYP